MPKNRPKPAKTAHQKSLKALQTKAFLFLLGSGQTCENEAVEVRQMAYVPYQPPMAGSYPSIQSGYNPAPYQAQPVYQPQQQAQPVISGRMVTSREEALGVPVDFMGGVTVLPDLSHGRIYTKVFNPQTGSADFVEFRAVPTAQAQETVQPEHQQALAALSERVSVLEEALAAKRAPAKKGGNEA